MTCQNHPRQRVYFLLRNPYEFAKFSTFRLLRYLEKLAVMYIRFTIKEIDDDSRKPQGVFSAAYALLDSNELDPIESKQLREALLWFEDNLLRPSDNLYASRAIFWFKSHAHESIDQIWELVNLLKLHGHFIEVHKCRSLGNIAYNDKFQVAAYPSEKDSPIIVQ